MTHIVRYIFLGALALIPLFIVVQVVLWVNKLSFDFVIWLSYYTNSTLISALIIILSILMLPHDHQKYYKDTEMKNTSVIPSYLNQRLLHNRDRFGHNASPLPDQ